jgi:hypothetical protein
MRKSSTEEVFAGSEVKRDSVLEKDPANYISGLRRRVLRAEVQPDDG